MKRFQEFDPIAIAVWFFSVTGIAMFSNYPFLITMTLLGGCVFFILTRDEGVTREHLFFAILFIVLALANPLISHNGVTVLFVMNHNPVTLEALLYGINSAAMIVGVLYWFRSFTLIMTSDRLLRLTGSLSPKLSLVLSMALRFVPLFREQSRKVRDAQKALGLFSDDNIIDDIKGNMRIFSIIITWALENGIITADSMEARGFGTCRRTQFSGYRLRAADFAFIAASLVLAGVTAFCVGTNALSFAFYPSLTLQKPGVPGILGLVSYALLILMPFIIERNSALKWKYLQSGM